MEMVNDAVNWFEVPVLDFDRARRFYSTIFDYEMPETMMGANRMGFFLYQQGKGVGGAIIKEAGRVPSEQGPLVYLNGGTDLAAVLARVEAAGGKIVQPKTQVTPEIGFVALFTDSEGNRLGLHSMK